MSFIVQEIPAPTVFGIGNVTGIPADGVISFEVGTQDTLIYNATALGNFTLDVVFDPTLSLNVAMQPDDTASIRFGALMGGTPYQLNGLTIDGTASGISYSWINGFPSGVSSTVNYYDFQIIKTGEGLFSVIGQQLDTTDTFVSVPTAPLNPGASAINATGVNVTFSAPSSDGGVSIIDYFVSGTPGGSATTTSFSANVFGLITDVPYTFKVRARNNVGSGPKSVSSPSATPFAPAGQIAYTSAGTYTYIAPDGVNKVSVVAVGGGGGRGDGSNHYSGAGGGLGYKNNISTTPGSGYTVVVGAAGGQFSGGQPKPGGDSYFISTGTVLGGGGGGGGPSQPTGGTYAGDGGGNGGTGGISGNLGATRYVGGGGGAGGYAGDGGAGGAGGASGAAGTAGSGGGGGGGGAGFDGGGGGGGVGLLGQGSNGTAGAANGGGGGGGSGGTNGANGVNFSGGASNGAGGLYGAASSWYQSTGAPARGAVRIIWPGGTGLTRAFPSTNTGNL